MLLCHQTMENMIHVLGAIFAFALFTLAATMWLSERGAFDAFARFLPRSRTERLLLAVIALTEYSKTTSTPTISRRGRRVARRSRRTARCSAAHTIARKGIGDEIAFGTDMKRS